MMKPLSGESVEGTYSENYLYIRKKEIFIIIKLLGNILLEQKISEEHDSFNNSFT
jgi:hypothetical protein